MEKRILETAENKLSDEEADELWNQMDVVTTEKPVKSMSPIVVLTIIVVITIILRNNYNDINKKLWDMPVTMPIVFGALGTESKTL